jgi:anti-anti-sigma factor
MGADDLLASDALDRLIAAANQVAAPVADPAYVVRVERRPGFLVLIIEGRVTQLVPDEFEQRVEAILDLHDAPRTVCDLSRCAYISSSVMAFLMRIFRASTTRSGLVVLIRPNQRILTMLALVGLDQCFLTVDDEAMAREYFAELDRVRPASAPRLRPPT